MKNLLIFGLFVIALIMVQFAQAQTADEVINKLTDALGGKEKITAIHSVLMEGVMVRNGNEITSKTTKVQGKLYRNETNFGMGSMTILVTPEKGWQTNFRNGGAIEPMIEDGVKGWQSQLDCVNPLVDYIAKGHKAELVGKDTLDNVECYKIKLTTKTGKDIFYWIDSKTYLLNQSSQKGGGFGGRGGDAEFTVMYKDYKAVEGVMFPFTTEAKGPMGGSPMIYEKIEVNKPVDEKMYKPE